MRQWVTRWVGFGLLGVAGLLATWLGVAALVYSPEYVTRLLSMREPSQSDHLENFPTRALDASISPYEYEIALDPSADERLEAVFATAVIEDFMHPPTPRRLS